MAYADNVNPLGDNTFTMKKDAEAETDDRKEVGLEVDAGKIKYVLTSRQQNAGQNRNIKKK
jgi:hypothetical protein